MSREKFFWKTDPMSEFPTPENPTREGLNVPNPLAGNLPFLAIKSQN